MKKSTKHFIDKTIDLLTNIILFGAVLMILMALGDFLT